MALFLANQFIAKLSAEKQTPFGCGFTAKILDVRHKFTTFLFRCAQR